MRRPLDRASPKSQLLRRRIVVNGSVGIVDLGIEHLMWPAPRSGERIGRFSDDRLERFGCHEFLRYLIRPGSTKVNLSW